MFNIDASFSGQATAVADDAAAVILDLPNLQGPAQKTAMWVLTPAHVHSGVEAFQDLQWACLICHGVTGKFWQMISSLPKIAMERI